MKATVPPTAKIAKDAKECVQECVSEFISFITSEAAEKCQLEKRKTIGGEDILNAMRSLGFEDYAETLKVHLAKLRDVCGGYIPLSTCQCLNLTVIVDRCNFHYVDSCTQRTPYRPERVKSVVYTMLLLEFGAESGGYRIASIT